MPAMVTSQVCRSINLVRLSTRSSKSLGFIPHADGWGAPRPWLSSHARPDTPVGRSSSTQLVDAVLKSEAKSQADLVPLEIGQVQGEWLAGRMAGHLHVPRRRG